jgi:signal transduction histidine kinase
MSSGAVSSVSAGTIQHHTPTRDPIDCDTREDGTVFIVTDDAVHRTLPGTRLERLGPLPLRLAAGRPYIAGGTQGDVHLVRGDGPNDRDPYACDASPAELRAHGQAAWRCARVPDVGQLRDVVAVSGPNGEPELWLASFSGGVLHRVDGDWRSVDALRPLQQRATNALARSPTGGVWVAGFGFVVRLAPVGGQWQIVEELSGWHGVEGDVRAPWEEPNGTVWLASWRGVTRVPPAARSRSPTSPSARLITLRVDGDTMPATDAVLPPDHRAIEVEFTAGVLRDPHRARYRTRLDDVDWTETPEPVLRIARVPAGDHVVEVAASLDGLQWGEPYRLEFRVERAWYARAWVFATGAALLLALALVAHRLRTAHLIGLERQRTSIAMDLHDELGAGLGSLGILGGVVAQGTAPSSAQRQMGDIIARTAAELGESLHDIVYSLRTGEARVEHLAEQVVSRGRTLFAGNGVHFTAHLAAPTNNGGVAPSVSRHAYRIAVEALHNAARHANAANIEVGLATNGRNGRLRLWVEDDGRGIDQDALSEPGGMGLITMRRRAEAIGGTLTIESPAGSGTRITLDFDPHGRREHLSWWRARRVPMQRGAKRRG